MLLSRRRRVSGGGRRPRKRRASVAATARRSRPSVFGRRGAIRRLSTRGGGARAAAVERDRVRASIGPPSGANPDIPSLREHWLRTKYASRKALSCLMRGKSCRLALRAARAARCAIFAAVAVLQRALLEEDRALRAGSGLGDTCPSKGLFPRRRATPYLSSSKTGRLLVSYRPAS